MSENGDRKDMLVCVYNTDGEIFRIETDAPKAAVSPSARECALYRLTCGANGMKREWEAYLAGLDHDVHLLRRNEMEVRYPAVDVRLPAVLKDSGAELTLVLDAGEIRACRDLDELTDLLTYKLEHTGVLMHGL